MRRGKGNSKLIADAKAGDLVSLKILSQRFQNRVELISPEVVEALFSHFDVSKLPKLGTDPSPSPPATATSNHASQNIARARTVLLGFEAGFENLDELIERRRGIESILLSRWRGVLKWIWYFLATVIAGDARRANVTENSKNSLVESMVHLIIFHKILDGVQELVNGAPGALKLATLLWLQHRKIPVLRPAGSLLLSTFVGKRIKQKRGFDEILDAVNGDAPMVVDALLEPFRLFLVTPTPFLEARVTTSVGFFHSLIQRPKHELCRLLLTSNAIPLVIKSALYCLQHSLTDNLSTFIVDSFRFLSGLVECFPSELWAFQAIRAGLPTLFLRSRPVLAGMEDEETVKELSKVFICIGSKFLGNVQMVRAVTTAVIDAMKSEGVDEASIFEQAEEQPNASGVWLVFCQIVRARFSVLAQLDYGNIQVKTRICDNCLYYANRLLTCSGCKQAFYCSVSCQTQAWRQGGHREGCNSMKLDAEPTRELAENTQREFITKVILREMGEKADSFFNNSQFISPHQFGPGEEIDDIGIVANFGESPVPYIRLFIPDRVSKLEVDDNEVTSVSKHRLPCQRVRLSRNSTAYFSVSQPHHLGNVFDSESFEVLDFWKEFKQYSQLEEPPELNILPQSL